MWSMLKYAAPAVVLTSAAPLCLADIAPPAGSLGDTTVRVDYSAEQPVHRLDLAARGETPATADGYLLAALQDDAYGPADGNWEFILGGNGFSNTDFDAHAIGLAASLGYFFNEAFELGVRQSLNFFDNGGSEFNGSTRVFLDFHFDLDRWRPFVGGSFGYIYGDSVNDTWTAGLEAGLKWYALPKTFIFGMIEYLWFFDEAGDADDTFDDGQFVYTFGIGFNF